MRQAGHLSIEVFPDVECLSMIVKHRQLGGCGLLGDITSWGGGL